MSHTIDRGLVEFGGEAASTFHANASADLDLAEMIAGEGNQWEDDFHQMLARTVHGPMDKLKNGSSILL